MMGISKGQGGSITAEILDEAAAQMFPGTFSTAPPSNDGSAGATMQHAIDYAGLAEDQVIAAAQAGDPQAFRAIMQRHNQHLFRVARSLMRSETEAEDVLQEAYVRAFEHLSDFRGDSALATWLTRIVINQAKDRLRAAKPTTGLDQVERPGAQVIGFPGHDSTSPEADAARAQVRRLLENAIDRLPEPFRMVLILRDVEEMSVEETSAQLNLKSQTVRSRLHRARRLLRDTVHAELQSVLTGAYPFLGARCERITQAVLTRLRAAA
jgi:RNA polymerase sigma-70 factor (ECF subfamily)